MLLKTSLENQQYTGVRIAIHHCALHHVLKFITQKLTSVECPYCVDFRQISLNRKYIYAIVNILCNRKYFYENVIIILDVLSILFVEMY